MAQTKKTDNAFLADKVKLRSAHLPKNPSVLDCYAGNGTIWNLVQKQLPGVTIKRLAIEKKRGKGKFHLTGDNVRYLASLDLSMYNVIDLDAYGVPYEQLRLVFQRGFHGLVFFTFIQSVMGMLPHEMLLEVGFTKDIIHKAPTLCGRRGWSYFLQFLAIHGVRKIIYIQHQRKFYGYFSV